MSEADKPINTCLVADGMDLWRRFFSPNRFIVLRHHNGCLFLYLLWEESMVALRKTWVKIIYLLCVSQLILIGGTLGAYWLWHVPAVLGYGLAIAVPLASALAAAIRKFRW
jgi:hypothetical protein